jgi:hypothetical protein
MHEQTDPVNTNSEYIVLMRQIKELCVWAFGRTGSFCQAMGLTPTERVGPDAESLFGPLVCGRFDGGACKRARFKR